MAKKKRPDAAEALRRIREKEKLDAKEKKKKGKKRDRNESSGPLVKFTRFHFNAEPGSDVLFLKGRELQMMAYSSRKDGERFRKGEFICAFLIEDIRREPGELAKYRYFFKGTFVEDLTGEMNRVFVTERGGATDGQIDRTTELEFWLETTGQMLSIYRGSTEDVPWDLLSASHSPVEFPEGSYGFTSHDVSAMKTQDESLFRRFHNIVLELMADLPGFEQLEAELSQARLKQKEVENELLMLQRELSEAGKRLARAEENVVGLRRAVGNSRYVSKNMRSKLQAAEAKVADLTARSAKSTATESAAMQAQRRDKQAEEQILRARRLREELATAEEELSAVQREIETARKELPAKLEQARTVKQQAESALQAVKGQVSAQQQMLREASTTAARMERELSTRRF